jgi:tape measure domain-containing protein
MAQTQINLGVALNFDDSQYKSGVKSVEQSLKKFSTTPAFVKLKLDDTDFRKQYQVILADLQKKVQKTGALNYKTTKGKAKVADSISTIQAAYKYNLEQSQNTKLSAAEINTYKKREEVLRQYLNLLKLVGQETKRNAQLEKERANMGVRMEKARMTGKVAAERQRAYKAEFADEIEAKKADELFRRRWAHEFQQWNKKDAELTRLQREADNRAKDARRQYDQKINAGTDTRTPELNDLRKFYQEQEKLANKAAKAEVEANKEIERQFKSRIKSKRNAANIETAIDNERLARERANAAKSQTNANRTEKNIRQEIKALRDLKKAEDALDKSQGKRARNARKNSATNQRIAALMREANALRDATRAARENEKIVNSFTKQGTLLGRLSGLASRYFSIYSVIHFGQKVAETTGYFKQQQVALEGILGSASKAREVLNDITNFALKSPFQTKELVGFTKQLSAFGIGGDDLFPTVTKLADISAGLGVDMSRIILAYGQVKSASVLRGQELRQFTEAGVPMVEKLAKKFEALNGRVVTTAEVFELISKRQVPFEMVASVLSDMTAEGGEFYKMQENITNTLYGQIEKLKDMWNVGMRDIGNASSTFFTGIIKLTQILLKNVKSIAIAIGAAFAAGNIAKFALHFDGIIRKTRILVNSTKFLKATMAGLAGVGVGVLVGIFSKVYENAVKLRDALADVDKSFSKDTEKMVGGLDSLAKKLNAANIGTKEYKDAVETLAQNYGDFISSDIIQALNGQGDAAHQTAMEFAKIAENVKEAIRSYNEYNAIKEKQNVTKDTIVDDATETFKRGHGRQVVSFREKHLKKDFADYYDRDASSKDIRNEFTDIFSNAAKEFVNGGVLSKEEFERIFTEKIQEVFPSISKNELLDILHSGWTSLNYRPFAQNDLDILRDLNTREQKSDYYGLNKYFEAIDPSKTVYYNGEDQIDFANNIEAAYIEAVHKTLKDKFGTELPKELSNMLDGTYGKFGGRTIATNFDNNTISEVNIALKEFANSLDDANAKNFVEEVIKNFKKGTEIKTGRAAIVSDLMENNDEFRNSIFKSVKSLWSTYIPSDNTYKQKRDQIKKDYDERVSERDSYISKGGKDKARIDELNAEIEALKKLASVEYYNVDLSSKNGGNKNKYEKIRITDFMDELLSLTTKAEDATKKIVGVTGYTDELGEFVGGLSKDNFLKGFFEEGGNPFEKILGRMSEFGVTDFLPNLNAESLKAIFKNAGWEEGKEMSVPDFRAIYENVIKEVGGQALEGLKKKRETVAKDSPEYNSINAAIDALQEKQVRALENMTARWDSDEIEKKLESMIKELTDINGNFEKQKSQRDMFERIGKAGSYRDAQNAIYGKGSTPLRFDKSSAARNTALSLLGAKGGLGVASTNAGQRLTSLLSGGHLNIENLNALTDIMYDLEEQAAEMDVLSKAEGSEEAKKNAKQFGDVTKAITQIIKEMVDSIISDYEELSKYRSSDMVAGDNIVNAKNDFQTANDLINDFINQRLVDITKAYKKGEIDIDEFDRQVSNTNHEADKMRIKVTQDLYNTMLTNLGGQELPDWIAALFGENNGTTGISQSGKSMNIMNAISGQGGGIESLVAMGVQKRLEKGEYKGEEDPEAAAAEAAQKIIATIKAVGSVFSTVDQAIQVAVEMGKGVIDALNATDNRLGLSKGTNGAMYDKDGNLNIDEEYYEKQNRRETAMQVMNTIGDFSSGISGAFQKFMQGDFFGAFAGIFTTITNLIGDIAGTMDSQIRHQQEALIRSNEDLARSMEGLEDALEDAAGIDKFDVQSQQIANLQQQKQQYDMLLALENEKKNGDSAKAQEYASAAVDAQREIDEIMDNIQTEVLGTADQLASTLTDPLVDAFRNGENAARAWRDAVKSYVSDVLKDILMTKVVAPKIQEILDQFMGDNTSSDDIMSLFKDEDKVGGLVEDLNEAGTGLIDEFNNLPDSIKDLIGFNSEQSSLSGGISGITEDTARQLEGLANSMLMQQIIGNSHLASMSSHLIATIQISWFNGMLEQAKATRIAAENLDRAISDMRNGIRPMSVTMV